MPLPEQKSYSGNKSILFRKEAKINTGKIDLLTIDFNKFTRICKMILHININ